MMVLYGGVPSYESPTRRYEIVQPDVGPPSESYIQFVLCQACVPERSERQSVEKTATCPRWIATYLGQGAPAVFQALRWRVPNHALARVIAKSAKTAPAQRRTEWRIGRAIRGSS